jgi:glucose/arabinose dehydrogenase
MRRLLPFLAACALIAAPAAADTPAPAKGLIVPPGFTIETIAHVPHARELAIASNGDLFIGTSDKIVYLVPDAEVAPGPARPFVSIDDAPVADVMIDEADKKMYFGGQFGVYSMLYELGDLTAREDPAKIADVRTSGESRDHVTTTLAMTKGWLYASVGSSCNNCQPELDATRATIQQMRPDGKELQVKAEHIRNAIALAIDPADGALWAGVAGQDELEHGHPYEIFDDVTSHAGKVDYGWPYCYENRRAVGNHDCSNVPVAKVIFPAYNTPIGATFYPLTPKGNHAFPAMYRGGAFVALHGSWHKPLVPPRVAFVPFERGEPKTPVDWSNPNTQWTEFVGGFQKPDETRIARPTGIAVGPEGSLFVSDDQAGNIYRIRPTK